MPSIDVDIDLEDFKPMELLDAVKYHLESKWTSEVKKSEIRSKMVAMIMPGSNGDAFKNKPTLDDELKEEALNVIRDKYTTQQLWDLINQ